MLKSLMNGAPFQSTVAQAKVPSWLGGGAHWAGFSWTNAALPAYTLATALVVWTSFPFIAIAVLAGLRTTAFQLPPAYGLASALAFILTIVLLIITVGYVRASVREGALR
jgi:ABC-type sugar transport system permease subunit